MSSGGSWGQDLWVNLPFDIPGIELQILDVVVGDDPVAVDKSHHTYLFPRTDQTLIISTTVANARRVATVGNGVILRLYYYSQNSASWRRP